MKNDNQDVDEDIFTKNEWNEFSSHHKLVHVLEYIMKMKSEKNLVSLL